MNNSEMQDDENDSEYFGELECTRCGGDGYFFGTDTPGFDYVNDDPNETYECFACRGSGKRKDQTAW